MSIQINGFRYAGLDKEFGDETDYETNFISIVHAVIKERFDKNITIVAFRPKHEDAFESIPPFFNTTHKMLKEELKNDSDLAWRMLLKRKDIGYYMNYNDNKHSLSEILPFCTEVKSAPVKQLASLFNKHIELNSSTELNLYDKVLDSFGINIQACTRRKIPQIRQLTETCLNRHPILRFVSTPYYVRYHAEEENGKQLIQALTQTIK